MSNESSIPQNPENQPPGHGQDPQQQGHGQNQLQPPRFQHGQAPPPGPGPDAHNQVPKPPKGRFGPSFWIVGGILAVIVLVNTMTGNGEAILIVLGIAAVLTGLYAMGSRKKSWASIPNRKVAAAVAIAGAASLLCGGIAAGVSGSRQVAAPATSATMEAEAEAKLKAREDALVKAESDSSAKLKEREDAVKVAEEAVKAREVAVGGAEAAAAANIIKEGTWTVGKDIAPGTYRTTKELTTSCYWAITVTGSNGGDIIENDNVKGGFPQVVLSEGQTFESSRCGTWTKQ